MRIASGGKSDVGQQRGNNEDSFRIVEALDLFVISDGMGGEAHGEIASAMAVETVVKTCMGEETAPRAGAPEVSGRVGARTPKTLFNAVHFANKKIFESAEAHIEQQGMGATLTAAWINEEKLSVVHVGDSRAVSVAQRRAAATDQRSLVGGRTSAPRNFDRSRSGTQRNAECFAAGAGNAAGSGNGRG